MSCSASVRSFQVSHEMGAGGGVFCPAPGCAEAEGPRQSRSDLIGVPVPEGHVEVGILGQPLPLACRDQLLGPAVLPGRASVSAWSQLVGQCGG